MSWDHEGAVNFVNMLAEAGFFESRKFGVYRHGGEVGWLTGLVEFPDLSRVLTRLIVEVEPGASFTSVMVSHNAERSMHKDSNNDPATKNYVVPIHCPDRGGELWVELKPDDIVKGNIAQRVAGGKQVHGQLYELQPGKVLQFSPRRLHEVSEWTGNRTVYDCLYTRLSW